MTICLGIETSCDETAAAIVKDGRIVLSNCIQSQIRTHQTFGGVVPEVAAREHLESINQIIDLALSEARLTRKDLSGVACTVGPGLIGTLLVGIAAAQSLSFAWDLPLIGVDHLYAHVCANFLETDLEPPFICLLVSGGHSQIVHFSDYNDFKILGQTVDDAAGEAYDKVARLLGLPYPGGPAIDKLAHDGNPHAFKFPEAKMAELDFSFSGLKTAVLRCLEKLEQPWPVSDIAASFQDAVTTALVRKTIIAQEKTGVPFIVLAGGVAANTVLRAKMQEQSKVPVIYPPVRYCTDNAAMVAAAAYFTKSAGELGFGGDPAYSRQKRSRTTRTK